MAGERSGVPAGAPTGSSTTKRAASAGSVGHPHLATVQRGELGDERETQTAASVPLSPLGGSMREPLENQLAEIVRDARPGVVDLDPGTISMSAYGKADQPAAVGASVGDDVADDAFDPP